MSGSHHSISQAILLAAGFGMRLRPLTLTTPKALLPLDGTCLIDHQLRYLAHAGISRVVINLHHLGAQIQNHVGDGSRYGLEVRYSEEPHILGTGGGVRQAARFLDADRFLLLNADALMDVDLKALGARADGSQAAIMVLKEQAEGDRYTPVSVDAVGSVQGFGEGRHFYVGLSILTTKVVERLPPVQGESSLIGDGIMPLLQDGERVDAFLHAGYFNDLGTPERYAQARQDIASGEFALVTDEGA